MVVHVTVFFLMWLFVFFNQGFELNGNRIAVRYPDRIPHGMGISKSALIADDFDNMGYVLLFFFFLNQR